MASEQLIRKDNKPHDEVDQGQVPQVARFESVTVMQEPGAQPGTAAVVHRVAETVYGTAPGGIHDDQTKIQMYEQQRGAQQSVQQVKRVESGPNKGSQQAYDQTKNQHSGAQQRGQFAKESHHAEQTGGFTDAAVDVGKRGTIAGKGIAMETGKTAAEFACKAAGVAKDAAVTGKEVALEAGKTAGEFAGKAAGVAKDAVVTGKDIAFETGKAAGEFARKAAGVAKDAALVAGWAAGEFVGNTATGVTESMESINADVSELIEDTAVAAEVGASYIGETAVRGKDVAIGTGKTTAGVAKDATVAVGRTAAEFASETEEGVRESMGSIDAGVARVVEGAAVGAEQVANQAIGVADAAVGAGKKGAGYVGQTMVRGKDVTFRTGKTTADMLGKGAGLAAEGVREATENINSGVGGVIENAAVAAEMVGGKVLGAAETVVDIGKKGAGYVGEKVVAGKDVTVETGKATGEYVGKAAGVVKDATLVAGWSAAELASDAAAGVTESMESLNYGVGGLVKGTASTTEDVAQKTFNTVMDVGKKGVDVGKKGVDAGKNVTLQTGTTAGEYVVKAADVAKDATLAAGWSAAELVSDTTEGVTESMESLNYGVGGLVECAALATEDVAQRTFNTVVDMGKKGASYIGEKAVAGKDVTLDTGKATAGYVGKGAGVVKDAALVGGWSALELASDTTEGLSETMENINAGVAGLVENAAVATEVAAEKAIGLKDTAVEAGSKGAGVALETGKKGASIVLETGKTAADYVGKAADVAKDVTSVDARGAAVRGATESGSGTKAGIKTKGVVVEREKITVDSAAPRGKTKKVYKEGHVQ